MSNKCAEIPWLRGYYITTDGDVYHRDADGIATLIKHKFNKIYTVEINDVIYDVEKLLLRTYCGIIDFPIYRHDPKKGLCLSNISYRIDNVGKISDNFIMLNNAVIFAKIPNTDRYFISNNGVVFDALRIELCKIFIRSNGYSNINLNAPSYGKTSIHRLVYSTWIGPIAPKHVIDHVDGNKWNNNISNLEMITSAENNQRAFTIGLKHITWSKDTIRVICSMMQSGMTVQDIYKALGARTNSEKARVTRLVSGIYLNKVHRDISKDFNFDKYNPKINHHAVIDRRTYDAIVKLLEMGWTQQKIADLFETHRSNVLGIHLGTRKRPLK